MKDRLMGRTGVHVSEMSRVAMTFGGDGPLWGPMGNSPLEGSAHPGRGAW